VTPLVKAAMAKLRDEKVALSVSSLRAYGLNEDLLADMATMKAQGLTFAPEAGTQRMRDVITKNVTEEDITESAHRVFGPRLPAHEAVLHDRPAHRGGRGRARHRRDHRAGRADRAPLLQAAQITASVSTHVPKPHTPFQWAAMDSEAETGRKQTLLAETARALRVDLKMHENHQSHLEGSSRAAIAPAPTCSSGPSAWAAASTAGTTSSGRAVGPGHRGGARALGLRARTLPGHHPGDGAAALGSPGHAARADFLAKEYRKALKDRLSPPCGKPYKQLLHHTSVAAAEAGAKQKLVCYDCGIACDLDAMKTERLYYLRRMNAWTPPRPVQRPSGGAEDAVGISRKSRQPTTRAVQGEPRRYRLRYTKLGRHRYLGTWI
jgi:hypothetical protein